MKQKLLLISMALWSLTAMADNAPGLVVSKTDGTSTEFALSQLKNITFSDGSMTVLNTDGTSQVISLEDIDGMKFSDVTAAISALAGNAASSEMTVSDLSGRLIYKGSIEGLKTSQELNGVYVITVDGKSHKVVIGK